MPQQSRAIGSDVTDLFPVGSDVTSLMEGSAPDEQEFQKWYKDRASKLGLDLNPDAPEHFYDYRAAHRAGAEPDQTGHWPSEFKREGHPRMVVDGVNTKTGEPVEETLLQKAARLGEGLIGVPKRIVEQVAKTGKTASDELLKGNLPAAFGAIVEPVMAPFTQAPQLAAQVTGHAPAPSRGEAAVQGLETAGIPAEAITSNIKKGNYLGATGEVLGAAAMLAGPHLIAKGMEQVKAARKAGEPVIEPATGTRAEVKIGQEIPAEVMERAGAEPAKATANDMSGVKVGEEIPANLMGENTFAGPERRGATRLSQEDWLAEQARKKQTEVQQGMQEGTLTLEDTIAKRPEAAMKEAGEAARAAQAAAEGRPKGRGAAEPTAPVQEPNASVIAEQPAPVNAAGLPDTGRTQPSLGTIEAMAEAAKGEPLTPERALGADRTATKEMVEKLPEPMREPMRQVLEDEGGFETQRRGTVPDARTLELAKVIQVDQKTNPRGTILTDAQTMALANAIGHAQERITKLSEKVLSGAADDVEVAQLMSERAGVTAMMGNMFAAGSEQGRALRIHQHINRLFETADTLGLREAMQNPKLRENLAEFSKDWAKLKTPQEKLEYLRSSQARTWGDTATGLFYSNVLGPLSHMRNIIGTSVHALFRQLATQPANVAAEAFNAVREGRGREIFLSDLKPAVAGATIGLRQGMNEALFALKNGYTARQLREFEAGKPGSVPRTEFAGGGKNPFNWSGRALEAEDAFMYALANSVEKFKRIHAKALGQAIKDGLTGDTREQYVRRKTAEWGANTPKDILEASHNEALHVLFRDEPGAFAKWLMRGHHDAGNMGLLMRFIVPFIKTPGSVARHGIEAVPGGSLLTSQGRAELAGGGRTQSEAVGRAATATAVLAPLAYWAMQGNITGDGPKDPEKRAIWEQDHQRNSIKVGDKWVDYSTIQPLSTALYTIGNMADRAKETGELPNPAEIAVLAASGQLSQSFLAGVSDLNQALADPGRYGQTYIGRMVQSFVPFSAAMRNTTQTFDSKVRPAKSIADSVLSITPGLSGTVPAKVGMFGEEVERGAGQRGPNPIHVKGKNTDPIVNMLTELGIDSIGYPPSRLQKTTRFEARDLTHDERIEIGLSVRRALENFAQRNWQQMDTDVAKAQALREVTSARENTIKRIRLKDAQAQTPR